MSDDRFVDAAMFELFNTFVPDGFDEDHNACAVCNELFTFTEWDNRAMKEGEEVHDRCV